MDKRFKVMVVDDSLINVVLIQENLQNEYDVFTAQNGYDAIAQLEEHNPDLILLDVMMPDLNGFEVCIMIKKDERYADVPIIFLTSLDTQEGALRGLDAGGIDYLTKPVNFDLLKLRVRNHLALRERNQLVKEQRALLERQKEEYQTLFNEMLDGFALHEVIFDKEGRPSNYRFLAVNPAYEELTGLSKETIIGRTVLEVLPELEPVWIETFGNVAKTGKSILFENYSAELQKHFEVKAFRPAPNQFACLIADITKRKRAEAETANLQRKFQQAQKLESLGVLVGGVAHDFNNILAMIMGSCFLGQEDADKAKEHFSRIETAAQRGAELCRQMLAYAGKAQFSLDQVDMGLLIEDMKQLVQASMHKMVLINFDVAADLPCVVGDKSQISQVVMNLIINAAEAIGEAPGEINLRLEKVIFSPADANHDYLGKEIAPGSHVCLEVTDTGCGMNEEVKRRLFEPFYTTKFSGRGLGLSATLGIIQSHKGALQLASQLGEGTTFRIYLPADSSSSSKDELCLQRPQEPWRGSGTILLVDDEESILLAVSAMLKILGFKVMKASDGQEALAIYQEHVATIDLVLTDMGMPVMSGQELVPELKKIRSDLPIIVSSGFGEVNVTESIDVGSVAGILNKPYNFGQLRQILQQVTKDLR